MSGMRAKMANRLRSSSLSAVPPPRQSSSYSTDMAKAATSILYRSPIPSKEGRPVFILNAAAMPDTHETDFDSLLPYVLARLPEEDDLLKGYEYEVVFFAGDGDTGATTKKHRPGWGWFLQAYHVLSRAMRKRLQKLYIVHEKAWVRILTEIFSTIVSPKFRRKIYHVTASSLTNLAQSIQIENLLIPPSAYLTDRRIVQDIYVEHASGRRAFGARSPFPASSNGRTRFPRVLRETTNFVLLEENLTSEGLFRVPPHAKLRDVLKEAYDRGQKYIIWKDNGITLPVPPYRDAAHQDEILAEVDPKDAYSVFMAAALIKAWHLLPLLDTVAGRQEDNKMTAENLAVCFAPALLCGPDQVEDAKMSSIIRRVITQAVEMWPNGLRDACEQVPCKFYEDLHLPNDDAEWDDPLEESRGSGEGRASLEEQTGGIILEDNEKSFETYSQHYPEVSHEEMPPPLPPRSRVPSTQSSTDSTKRKPAPPLQVAPPRYSTVITDAPADVADSPLTYAATTDGFAPRRADDEHAPPLPPRWEQVSDEKSGTRNSTSVSTSTSGLSTTQIENNHVSEYPAQLHIPKRKNLTAAQVDNVGKPPLPSGPMSETPPAATGSTSKALYRPHGAMALPGLANLPFLTTVNGGTVSKTVTPAPPAFSQSEHNSPATTTSPLCLESKPSSAVEFRRPSIPASANRVPTMTGLARPIYPSTPVNPVTGRPPSKSTSLPVPGPKPRAISPGLLHRMPSFESRQPPAGIERKMLTPKKLNLRKQSVDDLRRLYEERAGTASALVEAGKWNNNS
ncbi:divergent CRAL/TRIO domain-containing protein [Phaeosphaeria sp. MPI-PUGE-AT-0046c]|nr:divergent CRAL/TRIO domain-containing protein [Phaeosphaeria sp. MPI-PUGE-AT-0046c]